MATIDFQKFHEAQEVITNIQKSFCELVIREIEHTTFKLVGGKPVSLYSQSISVEEHQVDLCLFADPEKHIAIDLSMICPDLLIESTSLLKSLDFDKLHTDTGDFTVEK